MNREIVTQAYLDKRNEIASSIQEKINSTRHSDPVDFGESVRPARKSARHDEGTARHDEGLHDLLDRDLEEGTLQLKQLKSERIRKLEEAKSKVEEGQPTGKDGYADKLVKYIPSEAIAFYLTLTGILANSPEASKTYYAIGLLLVGVFGTFLYLKSVWKIRSNVQIMVSCVAFLAWAISLDKSLGISPTLQALMLPIVTFILPLIDPPPPEEPIE